MRIVVSGGDGATDAALNVLFDGIDALAEASLRQDLTAVDPADPEVELEVFGNADIVDGDITGDAAVRISFAGRRFETDARGFDGFDDLSVPLVITNQDGVTSGPG